MTVHHFAGFLYRALDGRLVGLLGTVAHATDATPTDRRWIATGRLHTDDPLQIVRAPTRNQAIRQLLNRLGVPADEWDDDQ